LKRIDSHSHTKKERATRVRENPEKKFTSQGMAAILRQ
jgi:hypothetical protein